MSVSVTVSVQSINSPVGQITRASMPFEGGILAAVKYPSKPARILFTDPYGEVSYPVMSASNKKLVQALSKALADTITTPSTK